MAGLVIRDLTPEGAVETTETLAHGVPQMVTIEEGFEHVRLVMVRAQHHEVIDVQITTGRGVDSFVVDKDSRSPQQRTLLAEGRDYWTHGEMVFAVSHEDDVLQATLR